MILDRALTALAASRNALGFRLRNRIAWSRGPARLSDQDKEGLFAYLPSAERARAEARGAELRRTYDLDALHAPSLRIDYLENLYLLDVLEQCLAGVTLPARARVLDVGSKNWSYVFALQRFLDRAGARPVELHGVEVDAHAVYWNLHSRLDLAHAYMAQTGAPNLHFHASDVCDLHEGPFDLVTWFSPFLTSYPLLRWGLPLGLLAPRAQLARVRDMLRVGGHLLICTHTEGEREQLPGLLPEGLQTRRAAPLRSKLVPYHERATDRWGTLLVRTEWPERKAPTSLHAGG
jgi:SAM-dependent methyltransferase